MVEVLGNLAKNNGHRLKKLIQPLRHYLRIWRVFFFCAWMAVCFAHHFQFNIAIITISAYERSPSSQTCNKTWAGDFNHRPNRSGLFELVGNKEPRV